jgi:hypothetical protein
MGHQNPAIARGWKNSCHYSTAVVEMWQDLVSSKYRNCQKMKVTQVKETLRSIHYGIAHGGERR